MVIEPQFTKPFLIDIKEQVSTTDDYYVECSDHLDEFGFPIEGYNYPKRITEIMPPAEEN